MTVDPGAEAECKWQENHKPASRLFLCRDNQHRSSLQEALTGTV
jgi:hypothetical protein